MSDMRKLMETIEQINEVSDYDGPELDDVIERWEQLLAHFNIDSEDMKTQWDLMRVIFNRANQGVTDLPIEEAEDDYKTLGKGGYAAAHDQNKSSDLESLVSAINDALKAEEAKCKDRLAIIKVGRYTGRKAICKDVSIDKGMGRGQEVTYLLYVLRANGEVLNTDGDSRSYRPADEFEWVIQDTKEGPGGLGHENVLGNDHKPSYQQFPG